VSERGFMVVTDRASSGHVTANAAELRLTIEAGVLSSSSRFNCGMCSNWLDRRKG